MQSDFFYVDLDAFITRLYFFLLIVQKTIILR